MGKGFIDYYQEKSSEFNKIPEDVPHMVAGLAAEVGEVAAIFQKHRYKGDPIDEQHLLDELGDVLWYATQLITHYNGDLGEVMIQNIVKLTHRHGEQE